MLTQELKQSIAPRERTMNVVWIAFMVATVVYVAVAWFALGGSSPNGEAKSLPLDARLLTALLAAAAFFSGVGSFVLPRTLLAPKKVVRMEASGAGTAPTAAETAAMPHLPESERALLKYLPAYQTTLIFTWAMRESIAVYGLVLAILTRQPAAVAPFTIVSLALVAMARPRAVEYLEGIKGRV